MPNQVITVNRKKYAVGLIWQPDIPGQVARSYARSLARSMDKKLNLYVDYRTMIGLGAARGGLKNGMPSAAAEVMDSLTEYNSFLGVFVTTRGFYLVAVRNGIILEDKLFENEVDARTRYFELSEIPDWGALFAPGVWGMPRAIERNISDIITGRAHAILRPIGRLRTGLMSLVLLGVFGFVMLTLFREPIAEMFQPRPQVAQINPELAAEYKRKIEEKAKELDTQFEIQRGPEPLVMPFDNLPEIAERANVCYQAIAFLMQPIAGWVQTSADCGEDYATVQMRRTFGTVGDLFVAAGDFMPGVTITEINEDNVDVRAALPHVKTVASQDERDAQTVVRDVLSLFQAADRSIDSIEIVTDTLTNGVETVNLDIVEIAAQSKLTPMQFMEIFDIFGGVYMTRTGWNATNRMWNYEVIIYAK